MSDLKPCQHNRFQSQPGCPNNGEAPVWTCIDCGATIEIKSKDQKDAERFRALCRLGFCTNEAVQQLITSEEGAAGYIEWAARE